MKLLLVTTALVGLTVLPATAQQTPTAPETGLGAAGQGVEADATLLAIHDMNGDGRIDGEDFRLADANGDGMITLGDLNLTQAAGGQGGAGTTPGFTPGATGDAQQAQVGGTPGMTPGGTTMPPGQGALQGGTTPTFGQDLAQLAEEGAPMVFDLNNDEKIDATDLALADTNGDGVVDDVDMRALQAQGRIAPTTDANGDGVIDDRDRRDMAQAGDTAPGIGVGGIGATTGTPGQVDGEPRTALTAGMTVDDLKGERVYDANNAWIGEIGEVVVAADGATWAIIDVGGFLGIGEKPVAVGLADLNLLNEGADDTRLSVNMSKAELEALPRWEQPN